MIRFLQLIALCMLALLPVACLQQKPGNTKAPKKAAPLYLGSVHQLYPKMNCALLRIIGPMPSAGSTLIAHPADGSTTRIANLCVTSDKPTSSGFIMAEIRSGTVLRGDRVFVYRDLTHAEEAESEESTENALNDLAPDRPSNTPVADTQGNSQQTSADTSSASKPKPTSTSRPKTSTPAGNGAPGRAPDYLDRIPDDISGWD